MPLHSVALEVLKQTGPLAVSSANRHGHPAAITADEAQEQLGESVSVYLDGGPCADNVPSTILDLTGTIPTVLRAGAISRGPAAHGGVRHRRQRALRRGPHRSRPSDVEPAATAADRRQSGTLPEGGTRLPPVSRPPVCS